MILVLIVEALVQWYSILSRRKEPALHESPYVATALGRGLLWRRPRRRLMRNAAKTTSRFLRRFWSGLREWVRRCRVRKLPSFARHAVRLSPCLSAEEF